MPGLAPIQTMPATTMERPRKHYGPTIDPNSMVGSYKIRFFNHFNTPEHDSCRNEVPMEPTSTMYHNGPSTIVSNPTVFVDTNAYGCVSFLDGL